MRFHLLYILIPALLWGCKSKDDAPPPAEGIVFSPATPYQEALPGTVVGFKFRVAAPAALTSFGVRFKLPGATDFIALPQYPDQKTNANDYTAFSNFEYALPPSATEINADVQIKFVAATASRNYEKDYTVKMKKSGLQILKLYSTPAATLFNFSAIDLVAGTGVLKDAAADTKDLIGVTEAKKFPLEDVTFNVLKGWESANGARFKVVTAANYAAAPSTYGTIYNGIAATSELKGVSTLVYGPIEGIGLLAVGQFYIAKVMRNGTPQYIGLSVKRAPATTTSTAGSITSLDLANEYLQLEIKK